ncbi:MAG TPA: tetratricopeptide repeat protein [Elusimicrobiales bacterium]|nr:tetratricopeptide repeat protein [Elusimicrobiales bacterium]
MNKKNKTAVLIAVLFLFAVSGWRGLASAQAAAGATPAAQPASAVLPQAELKLEKLDLTAAVKDINAMDAASQGELYRALADIYFRAQKLDKAISLLETYRSQGGLSQPILYNLATFYTQRGAISQAIEVCEAMIKASPQNSAPAAAMLTTLYRQKGDMLKVGALLEAQAKASPADPALLNQLAVFHYEQGDSVKAEEAIKKSIAILPLVDSYRQLAQINLRQGSLDKAIATLQEGIKKLPGDEVALTIIMNDLYMLTGQPDKAIAVLSEASKRLPAGVFEFTIPLSEIYLRRGDLEKTEALLKNLLSTVTDPARKEIIQQRINALRTGTAQPAPGAVPAVR